MHRTQRMKNMHKTQIAQSTNKDRKHKHSKAQIKHRTQTTKSTNTAFVLVFEMFVFSVFICALCNLCFVHVFHTLCSVHICVLCFQTLICSRNSSKIHIVSIGPGAASGWNCTERHLLDLCRIPSFEPSFAFTNHSSHPTGRVFPFTA